MPAGCNEECRCSLFLKAAVYAGNRSAIGLVAYMVEEMRALQAGEKPLHNFEEVF